MTNLTSVLNFGALITLSCCNAVLQIAVAPSCGGLVECGRQAAGVTHAGAGVGAEIEPRLQGICPAGRSGTGRPTDRDASCPAAESR